jgi:hypothetical protein
MSGEELHDRLKAALAAAEYVRDTDLSEIDPLMLPVIAADCTLIRYAVQDIHERIKGLRAQHERVSPSSPSVPADGILGTHSR